MEYNRTYARISLDAVGKNVAGVRARIPEKTKIMAVIKADAYGHGAVSFAAYLCDKVDWFGVATLDEAVELRKANVKKDILVLGHMNPAEYGTAIENDVTVTVADYANAEKLSTQAQQANKSAKVHIKVDTGMSRIGFQATAENAFEVKKISCLKGLRIEGAFTHFAIADSADKSSALSQRERFDFFVEECRKQGIEFSILHTNNSAATMELDRFYDMVRMGIMLYGLYPSEEMDKNYPLYPAMELISHVSFVKKLEKGRGISYGHTYVTDREITVATVACGYADGYPRALSSNAEVLVGGKRCPVLGRVCMDQIMVDVSDAGEVNAGDEVVLFGKMGDEYISVEEVALRAYSFNYEFVCGIARRVPRVYFENGELSHVRKYL